MLIGTKRDAPEAAIRTRFVPGVFQSLNRDYFSSHSETHKPFCSGGQARGRRQPTTVA